jgi:protein-S-isoprenylcysteine O-methyltransferase Ste14
MDSNLEFRVLLFYLGAMYLFPVIRWRKTRRSPAVVGHRSQTQNVARLLATAVFVVPLADYLFGADWHWNSELGFPSAMRWGAALPATFAILILIWACRYTTEGGDEQIDKTFVREGPYHWFRHPQLLASSIFFLSLAFLSNNGVVLISAILGAFLLRFVVAPAVEADLVAEFGKDYQDYRLKTGSFFFRLGCLPKARYAVPRRFGLSTVLAFTTIFAFLFGVLNYVGADPKVYFFVSVEIAAICLAQIVFGATPRRGSALTGAVLLPFWTAIWIADHLLHLQIPLPLLIAGVASVVLFGALLGYLIGGLAAGFFLVLDLVEPYLPGSNLDSPHQLATKSDQKAK